MRSLTYLVGTTVDGYVAGPADETDFFPLGEDLLGHLATALPETLPTHVRAHLGIDAPNARFDTVVMGRRTYQPGLDIGVTSPYAHLRQFVVSRRGGLPEDPDVTVVQDDPVAAVRRLKQEDGGLDIWLAGGGTLAGALLPEIDELVVKCYPVVAGAGVPVFAGAFTPTRFEPVQRREFGGTLVTTYRRG
ncbi:dihydrofolate reductase [Geodermatophilus bullaregiensis]|uniref:dihydrofolate reductase family protein n=1 Tax=Geodermatophilus bullaregiensis TaxID=1564160 RepID=UPI001956824A|nr:dihydrofolate reductase family protein [Geodermatophilus bullaregiensis]MBM7808462.1 dihydrofolate reductase [Geodermatophilus bullaregiensis]